MDSTASKKIRTYKEIKKLNEDLFKAEQELKQAKGRYDKNKFRDLINEIKLDLGWALLECGEYEKGLAVYQSVFGKQYEERKYNGIGTALTELGLYDEAKRILEYGLRQFPNSCALWTDMGILYDKSGDYSEVLKCFEVALRVTRGENSGPLYNKALILTKLGSYEDAMSIIDDLIERHPREPGYLAEKAFCLLEIGYPQEALEYLQRAMGLFERFPSVDAGVSIYTGLCCAYRELGMRKESMEISLEGLKQFPDEDPILYHNLGACFYELGWIRESKEVLQEGIEKFPEDEELKMFLNDVEEDDDPDGDIKPRLLSLLLLAILRKKLKKKY
jgi:tetratricopeptide (TPR) repeat protein